MFKRILSLLLMIIIAFQAICITAYADNLNIKAKSYVLMEADTGKVIMENNADEQLTPASITKIMTLLLIYEAIRDGKIKTDDVVTVSEHAASMGGSQVFLEPFEKQTVADMLKCIIVASANDASVAMAEFIAGSEEEFVELMNKRASELGMKNTHFVNACGLDEDGHLMSARDVAIVSRELINNFPEIHNNTKIWQDSIIHKTRKGEKEFVLTNTNKLIKWYEWANGLKTGSTGKALYCLSGTAEKNGVRLIAVIMAAPDFKTRFQEAMKLFDYGFANYRAVVGKDTSEVIGSIRVIGGNVDKTNVYPEKKMKFLLSKNDKGTLETELKINDSVSAPTKTGTKVGELIYKINSNEVGRVNLIIKQDITKATWGDVMGKIWKKGYAGV